SLPKSPFVVELKFAKRGPLPSEEYAVLRQLRAGPALPMNANDYSRQRAQRGVTVQSSSNAGRNVGVTPMTVTAYTVSRTYHFGGRRCRMLKRRMYPSVLCSVLKRNVYFARPISQFRSNLLSARYSREERRDYADPLANSTGYGWDA